MPVLQARLHSLNAFCSCQDENSVLVPKKEYPQLECACWCDSWYGLLCMYGSMYVCMSYTDTYLSMS